MGIHRRLNNSVHHYMKEMTSRIVAKSGRPGDRFHLGKLILMGLKDAPEFLSQIDGATGRSETAGSVLERSVRCATCFRTLGLGCGDVVAILAPNHRDLCIPYYASLYLGITVAPLDQAINVRGLEYNFNIVKPKLVFCQNDRYKDIHETLLRINLEAKIVTFDESDRCMTFEQFHECYDNFATTESFNPADIDTENNIGLLLWTSGSFGEPKCVPLTHMNLATCLPARLCMFDNFPTPTRLYGVFSPFQWVSTVGLVAMSAILRFTRLQSSCNKNMTFSADHVMDLINNFKPTFSTFSPCFLNLLLRYERQNEIDWKSFEVLVVSGSPATQEFLMEVKAKSPMTDIIHCYGMTETGLTLANDDNENMTSMRPLGNTKCRLVDPNTGMVVDKPNMPGELLMKGPSICKGYYGTASETIDLFSQDGWFKSGDIFYRDEHHNYYFVERTRAYLKYVSKERGAIYMISPVEVENAIRLNPGVLDVGVTGIPHPVNFESLVAFVVRRNGCDVTAQKVIDLVEDPNTGMVVDKPNMPGELLMKGPSICKGYYGTASETIDLFSQDGWFKSGDIFYRDEHHNYYFVERTRAYLKYVSKERGAIYMISPVEVENAIRLNPGVLDVGVTGIPHPVNFESLVAFVVRRNGCDVTAQKVIDLVEDQLGYEKQLRGGVVFVSELPLTASAKINRKKLRDLAIEMAEASTGGKKTNTVFSIFDTEYKF